MITLENKYKISFFVEKNEAQISGFAVVKKSSKSLKKIFLEKKKIVNPICADMIFKTVCIYFY